ncbi:cation transporter [Candidatus Woesebacteria bacterium]|nr:cation transporter [Candidatus Woesebacteria bacterium]MCD8545893.1 cation transporter [Candidatus Woesebacteria bacterium]
MHCTSCSMNIDGELEDTPGVVSASTNYARATTKVVFDPQTVTPKKLMQVVEKLGYTATQN